MKTITTALFALALAVLGAFGQTNDGPQNFAGAGLGFQSTAAPQTSGWSEYCHRNPNVTIAGLTLRTFSCAATDYTGATTSARVDLKVEFFRYKWLSAGTQTGGGAAVNQYGLGGAWAAGGWAAADVSRWLKVDGVHFVGSITWNKDDVSVAQQQVGAPAVLRQLAARAVVRAGIGKAW